MFPDYAHKYFLKTFRALPLEILLMETLLLYIYIHSLLVLCLDILKYPKSGKNRWQTNPIPIDKEPKYQKVDELYNTTK